MTIPILTASEGRISQPTLPAMHAASASKSASRAFAQLPALMRGGLTPKKHRRVREHIEAHLEHRISIQDLAGIAGLSMHHFARAFKRSEGVSPHNYLLHRRIQRARALLASTDVAISVIAVACGFSDQSHCARRFKERVGVTPARYRWSMR
jgi:transcriptional regulator GlxA family with amidase domain